MCSINIDERYTDTLIETLLRRIDELKEECDRLKCDSVDAKYQECMATKEKALVEALEAKGLSPRSFKQGDIVVSNSGIYLVGTLKKNGFGWASARLYDFCCDGEHVFSMDIASDESRIEIDPSDNHRIASSFETMLFDHELEKAGYKRKNNGELVEA